MIGKCPNCNISLNVPPFDKRNTNEVILIIEYRRIIESGGELKKIEETGYCELCKATREQLEKQNI